MLKETGWTLKTIIYTGGEATHSKSGTWLAIRNELSTTGYVLRISNLGLMTHEYTDKHLGIGVNQHGSVRPMKGNADFKFMTPTKVVSEATFFDKQYTLRLSSDLSFLKLMVGAKGIIAIDKNGVWRYLSYCGYCAHDHLGRIQILRTDFNAAK